MKFFALDCHIGIRDIQRQFEQLGHQLDVHSISGHAHLMNWNVDSSFIVNKDNWKSLNQRNFHLFHEHHADRLKDYDGFVCFYPPSFSMLYEKFEKPIILQVPIRFEIPFHVNNEELQFYISHLQRTIDSGQLIPLANNRFDSEFCSDVVGREFKLIPSLCDYTGKTRARTSDDVVIHGDPTNKIPSVAGLKKLKSGYSWDELYSHKAIVHMPYHNTVMSLFEQYTAGMPLLFPSDDFLLNLWESDKDQILSQVSWTKIHGMRSSSIHKMNKLPDINNYNSKESIEFIIKKSDWNDEEWMPFIRKYESWDHLQHLIHSSNFDDLHELMRDFNLRKKEKVLNMWNDVLGRV